MYCLLPAGSRQMKKTEACHVPKLPYPRAGSQQPSGQRDLGPAKNRDSPRYRDNHRLPLSKEERYQDPWQVLFQICDNLSLLQAEDGFKDLLPYNSPWASLTGGGGGHWTWTL